MRLTQDQVGSGPSVLERLFQHDGEVYGHILQVGGRELTYAS